MSDQDTAKPRQFHFVRHGDQSTTALDWESGPSIVRKALSEALNARNIAFLLGAGCSSLEIDDKQRGIPTMGPLASEFCKHPLPPDLDDNFDLSNRPNGGLLRKKSSFSK